MSRKLKISHYEFLSTSLRAALIVSLLSTFLAAQSGAPVPALQSVPASRAAHLRHGINASEWFAQVYDKRGYTKEHFQSWTTAEDIALIKSMAFDHVRAQR